MREVVGFRKSRHVYMKDYYPTTYLIVVMEALHFQLVVASVETVLHVHLALGYKDGQG